MTSGERHQFTCDHVCPVLKVIFFSIVWGNRNNDLSWIFTIQSKERTDLHHTRLNLNHVVCVPGIRCRPQQRPLQSTYLQQKNTTNALNLIRNKRESLQSTTCNSTHNIPATQEKKCKQHKTTPATNTRCAKKCVKTSDFEIK